MAKKKIKAFTMAEIMIVLAVIAVVTIATVGIQKSRADYANKFMDYAAFKNIQDVVADIIAGGTSSSSEDGSNGVTTDEYTGCDPHLDPTCETCDPERDQGCQACNPDLDQDCTPCDPTSDSNCTQCDSHYQFCTSYTFDGKYPNFTAVPAAYENWVQMEKDHNNCYNQELNSDGYNSQAADQDCIRQYDAAAAWSAYLSTLSSTKVGSSGDYDCVLHPITGDYRDPYQYSASDNNCPSKCAGASQDITHIGSTGTTGWRKKTGNTTTTPTQSGSTKTLPDSGEKLCDSFVEKVNTVGAVDCNAPAVVNDLTFDFATTVPNFTTTNGMKWFNFVSVFDNISTKSTQAEKNVDYASQFYTIYIDIDGTKGKSLLNSDIMKFYVTRYGMVLPAEDSMSANNKKYLSAYVKYKSGTSYLFPLQNATYRQAACSADAGTGKIIPAAFNTKFGYCSVGITPDPATVTKCTTSGINCKVINNKPGF